MYKVVTAEEQDIDILYISTFSAIQQPEVSFTNERLQINVLPSETLSKIKNENDVKMVGENLHVILTAGG